VTSGPRLGLARDTSDKSAQSLARPLWPAMPRTVCHVAGDGRLGRETRVCRGAGHPAYLTSAGTSGQLAGAIALVSNDVLWYFLVTVVPFLRWCLWRTPNTYRKAGIRRGTATSTSTRPGTTSAASPPTCCSLGLDPRVAKR